MNTEQIVISFSFIHSLLTLVVYSLELNIYYLTLEGLLALTIVLYFITRNKQKFNQHLRIPLSIMLLLISLLQKNSGQVFIHLFAWSIISKKHLKTMKIYRISNVIIIMLVSTYQIYMNWQESKNDAIIYMQVLMSFLACYTYCEYQQISKQSNPETFQSSQKIINEDFHRYLTTRRSMNTLCSDFVILDVIPHGVLLLTCNQEFQHMNEKAMDQIYGLTGIKPNDENVVELINSILKSLLNEKSQNKNSINLDILTSRLVNSINPLISDDFGDNKLTPLEIIINNQKGSSVLNNKLITKYQIQGKTRSVRFLIQKQELPNIIIILLLDVTSKIEKKNQERKYKFQNQLLNSFSHELRTPLNCSQQMLESLAHKVQNVEDQKLLHQILYQNELLLCQINDILDYASMESDNFHSFYQEFQLEQLMQECKVMYEIGCQLKNIKFHQKLNVQTPIHNDYMRIKQVLVNLINNSIKFSSQNGNITLQAKQKIKNEKKLIKFKVNDDGVGFTQQQLLLVNHVLDQNNDYFDISTSMCIGLGLKVANKQVQSFAKRHNRLKIKSKQNIKTSVSFYVDDLIEDFELECQSKSCKTLSIKMSTVSNSEFKFISSLKCKCAKILIVDDIPFNHQALSIILNGFNLQCEHAFDGLEAIQLVKKRMETNTCHPQYQLILMDIEMPKMNGFESANKIAEILDYNKNKTKIVICSAYDNLETRQLSKQSNIDDFLPKPIQKNNLILIINHHLGLDLKASTKIK